VLSHRFVCAFALTLTVVPLALQGCSAAGDGASETNKNNVGSTSSGSTTGSAGSSGINIGGTPGLNVGGTPGAGGASTGCGQVLPVVYRDFNMFGAPGGHDDFEASARGVKNTDGSVFKGWNDIGCGLVDATLGADGKPHAFTGMPEVNDGITLPGLVGKQQRTVSGPGCWTAANPTPVGDCNIGTCGKWTITPASYSIKSAATFDQWYTTTTGINMEIPGEIPLVETPAGSGISVYDTNAFFPIDSKGFGNTSGQAHNYHFTTEIHVKFKYEAGQKFTFRGDDDLWIFVNGKLALDVGGQHQALKGVIDFDAQAALLGITAGSSYPMDIFHAERQTTESNFRIETNIKCFEPVVK
jgi:fibro-slime domain-containing protein